jgi:hypothetical protein
MIRHLKIHNIDVLSPSSSEVGGNSTKIDSFLVKEGLNEILAKCAAKDGFSYRGITKSEAIGSFVCSRGYKMPKSQNEVSKRVMDFFEEKKEETKNHLQALQRNGQ